MNPIWLMMVINYGNMVNIPSGYLLHDPLFSHYSLESKPYGIYI